MLLLFGFKGNISSEILKYINKGQKYVIESDIKSIENLIEIINIEKPTHILGLGEYSGKDQNLLRIEQECTNKFRNNFEGESIEKYKINNFLKSEENSKYSKGIGNSRCNLVSYKILKNFGEAIGYSFIHIPKRLELEIVAKEINSLINQIK